MTQDLQTYLYSFELTLVSLELPSTGTRSLCLQWRKGQKSVRTEPLTSRNKLIHLKDVLKLCLKLTRNKEGQYLPKMTTLSLLQSKDNDWIETSNGRLDLSDALLGNKTDMVVSMFPEPCKLQCRLKFEFVMELKHFRFGNQEIEESEEEQQQAQQVQEALVSYANEEEKLILKKEVEDLNYLNQKMRSDREKLLLRVRELELDFKEKEKLILREMRQAKSFFDHKIKLRETIYEEQIEKLVFVSNEKISECQEYMAKYQEQNEQLSNKLRSKQSQLSRLRDQLIKSRAENDELSFLNKALQEDRDVKHQHNFQQTQSYQLKLHQLHEDFLSKAQLDFATKQHEKNQLITAHEEERSQLFSQIRSLQSDLHSKSHSLEEMSHRLQLLNEEVDKKNGIIGKIDEMLNVRKAELMNHQFQHVQISHKLESMLSENKNIDQMLNQQMQLAEKDRKALAETLLKLENLTITYKLDQENFNQERETFRGTEAVYREDIAMLKNELKQLEMELQQLRDREAQLNNECERLQMQSEKTRQMLQIETSMVHRHQQDIQNLRRMLQERQQQLNLREREVEERNTEIDRLQIDVRKMAMAKEDVQSEIKKLQMISKSTQELYTNKMQRQAEYVSQFDDMIKKHHENQLEIQTIKSQLAKKNTYIDKLERKNGELTARLKMRKKDNSDDQSQSSMIFKSTISGITSPKEGSKISAIEVAHIKAQLEMYKKESDKKEAHIEELNRAIVERNQRMGMLEEHNARFQEQRGLGNEVGELVKRNQKISTMLEGFEQRVQNLVKNAVEVINNQGNFSSKSLTNKLSDDYRDLQSDIAKIKEEQRKMDKTLKIKKQESSHFSFAGGDSRGRGSEGEINHEAHIQIEEMQGELKQKDRQLREMSEEISHLREEMQKQKRMRLRTEQEWDEQHKSPRSKGERHDEYRDTFGPTKTFRRNESEDHEGNVESFRRNKHEKEMAMKESQMMMSSQVLDIKMQTLAHELRLKTDKEQEIVAELRDKNARVKELEDQLRMLKEQEFAMQQELRKFGLDLQSAERENAELRRNRDNDARNNQSAQVTILTRENTELKERENKLKNEVERISNECKDKYIRYTDHKDIIAQLDRTLKDKNKEMEIVRKELIEVIQQKNKAELVAKSQEQDSEEGRKRLLKIQDQHQVVLGDKETELKVLKKRVLGSDKAEEELEAKVESLQEKARQTTIEQQRVVEEFSKRNINQLKEINLLKEHHEVLSEELKVTKRRNQELSKVNNDNEEKILVLGKAQEENKRRTDKMGKELEDKEEHLDKLKFETKKLVDETKRLEFSAEEFSKERKSTQEEISQLVKTIDSQTSEIRRLTKDLQRTKSQVNQSQQDHFSTNKNIKLQLQRVHEDRRKLQKQSQQQQLEIRSLLTKIKKIEQDNSDNVASLNKMYGEKMGTALSQIQTIRKAVREAEQEIADYEVENRELAQEVERINNKLILSDNEKQNYSINLESAVEELEAKREDVEQLRKQKFQLEMKVTRASNELQGSQEDLKRGEQKMQKVLAKSQTLEQGLESTQSQLRALKSQHSLLLSQFSNVEPFQSKFKLLQKEFQVLQQIHTETQNQLKHKQHCVYTKEDFEKYEESLKERYSREAEFQHQKTSKEREQENSLRQEQLEAQMVELLNESTGLREELERCRCENSSLLQQAARVEVCENEVTELQFLLSSRDAQLKEVQDMLSSYERAHFQSSDQLRDLYTRISQLQKTVSSLSKRKKQLQSLTEDSSTTCHLLQAQIKQLKTQKQELSNRLLQQEFQNTRLKQNQFFEKNHAEGRIEQISREGEAELKAAESNYIDKIHSYNSEMDKLKNVLGELKYLVEEKSNTIEDLTGDNELMEQEIMALKGEIQELRMRGSEDKEVASLELFKMTTKLRETEEQTTLKLRRMEDEVLRISQQLMTSNNKFNNSRISEREDERVSKRYEEKLKLKDKTIEELKMQLMNLEAQLFKAQQQRELGGDSRDSRALQQLRQQNNLLRFQLQKHEELTHSSIDIEITHLNQQITTLRKKLAKGKKLEEELGDQLEQITLKYQSLCSEMIYYRGLESANKELKMKYEQICEELRSGRLERSTTSEAQHQLDMLESEKEDLEKQIEGMQVTIMKLTETKEFKMALS